jgi:3-deoxy-D-manno-octulosonic-acid transferase
VHVPRSPQRFDSTYSLLQDAELVIARRSSYFDAALQLQLPLPATIDVLLGDSLGEMSFYLKLADLVVVGNSFNGLGAHNIIEPLALKKPVIVGPSIWGIEYPAREALSAGALIQVADVQSLCDTLTALVTQADLYAQTRQSLDGFYEEHAGATAKHMAVLLPWYHTGRCP